LVDKYKEGQSFINQIVKKNMDKTKCEQNQNVLKKEEQMREEEHVRSFVRSFIHSFIHLSILFIYLFICFLVCLLIDSFIY